MVSGEMSLRSALPTWSNMVLFLESSQSFSVLPGLAVKECTLRNCLQSLILTSGGVIERMLRSLATGHHFSLQLSLLELLESFINERGRSSLVTRLDLAQTQNLVELGVVGRRVSTERG